MTIYSYPGKHTKYQPTDDEWKCPKCNAGTEYFYIDINNPHDEYPDCSLLHETDDVVCHRCGYLSTGKSFANALKKKHNLVPCPHCKGTGLIKKGEK